MRSIIAAVLPWAEITAIAERMQTERSRNPAAFDSRSKEGPCSLFTVLTYGHVLNLELSVQDFLIR